MSSDFWCKFWGWCEKLVQFGAPPGGREVTHGSSKSGAVERLRQRKTKSPPTLTPENYQINQTRKHIINTNTNTRISPNPDRKQWRNWCALDANHLVKSSGAAKYIFLWVTMVPKYNIEFSWGLVAMVTLRRTVVLRRGNDAESEASAWVNSVYPSHRHFTLFNMDSLPQWDQGNTHYSSKNFLSCSLLQQTFDPWSRESIRQQPLSSEFFFPSAI